MAGNNGGNGRKKSNKTPTVWVPTEKFKAVFDLRLNPDNPMNLSAACREAGADRSTIYDHLKKPEAVEYINRLGEAMFKAYNPHIKSALVKECLKGNVAAIRLYFELYGDLKQQGSGEITIIIPKELQGVCN